MGKGAKVVVKRADKPIREWKSQSGSFVNMERVLDGASENACDGKTHHSLDKIKSIIHDKVQIDGHSVAEEMQTLTFYNNGTEAVTKIQLDIGLAPPEVWLRDELRKAEGLFKRRILSQIAQLSWLVVMFLGAVLYRMQMLLVRILFPWFSVSLCPTEKFLGLLLP